MRLSDNLKTIRKENNLSQEQLAEKLGVSRQAVSKWESGQSYPEMDKILLICKLFDFNLDELMNENVKEVNQSKQSKINFNKYIDDFFDFITKTVDMFSVMTFKQKLKCFVEQIFITIVLLILFLIIGSIGSTIVDGIFGNLPTYLYHPIRNILQSIFIILGLIIGIIIFLHIFKTRYLDYYQIEKEPTDAEGLKNEFVQEKPIISSTRVKEKVIIRDPDHTKFKFLTGFVKLVLWFIKFIAACIALSFAFLLICLIACTILSFLFIKTGLVFFGCLLGFISAIMVNLLILELFYDFIISKTVKKNRLAISFVIALVLAGISIGCVSIGMTSFNYIEDSEVVNPVESVYKDIAMASNLSIVCPNEQIEYIETDSNEINITVKHSDFFLTDFNQYDDVIYIHYYENRSKSMEMLREIISSINNKEFRNYSSPVVYVQTSKANIQKLQENKQAKQNKETELMELYFQLQEKENQILSLKNENELKDIQIRDLENEIQNKESLIESLQSSR